MVRRKTLRNIEIFIILIIFSLSLYYLANSKRELTTYELIYNNKIDNLSCHYTNSDDALPTFNPTFSVASQPIFFHETSCVGSLNSRQMCAIESAAINHPERTIYVLFSGPVSYESLSEKLNLIYKLSNVIIARIHIKEYSANTPLQSFIKTDTLKRTNWGIENTSNVLRFLTLSKWGGVYLDTDVVVVKPLDFLGDNWIAKEDNYTLNAAVISLNNFTFGQKLAKKFVDELIKNYRGDDWAHNGPGVVTRVLSKYCDTNNLSKMTKSKCQDFTVLEPKYVYPIHYKQRMQYFQPGIPDNYPDAYIHHIWNKLTHHLQIPNNSLYSNLARRYCPSVYGFYKEKFGS